MKSRKFAKFDHTPIKDLVSMSQPPRRIKALGYIQELNEPAFEAQEDKDYGMLSRATVVDEDGAQIQTTNLDEELYHEIRAYHEKGKPIEFLASIEKEPIGKSRGILKNRLAIEKLRSGAFPLRRLRATRKEKRILREFLKAKRDGAGLAVCIQEAVVKELGIVGLEASSVFNLSLQAMIVQAFSGGRIPSTGKTRKVSAKINTCVIGPPASGKSLLCEVAKLLNVAFQESQPETTKITGVAGHVDRQGDKWVVKPGAIPLANKGVFAIQDFDKCSKKTELFNLFGPVMEQGKIIFSTAARATLEAETAIHIDMNRQSDLFFKHDGRKNVLEDIEVPSNILSRFDYIAELPMDRAHQQETARLQLRATTKGKKQKRSEIGAYCRENRIAVARFLKLVVATVMTKYGKVDISPVQDEVLRRFQGMWEENEEWFANMPEIASFHTRMANSLVKEVVALTRLQLRKSSNSAAVEEAMKFLEQKVEFLKTIDPEYLVPRATGNAGFAKWLFETYGDKDFSPKDVSQAYRNDASPCGEVSDKTIRNWINLVGEKQKHNHWALQADLIQGFEKARKRKKDKAKKAKKAEKAEKAEKDKAKKAKKVQKAEKAKGDVKAKKAKGDVKAKKAKGNRSQDSR